MFRNSRILVPTDFSDYAANAMRYAIALAQTYEGSLRLVHVLDVRVLDDAPSASIKKDAKRHDVDRARAEAEQRLKALMEECKTEGVQAEYQVAEGRPVSEIKRLAAELECDLVIVATHGHSGFDRFVFGSVCDQIVRESPVPVLSVCPPEDELTGEITPPVRIDRIMFPTDFSDFSKSILPYAVSLCHELNSGLVLFHAAEMPVLLPEFMLEESAPAQADIEEYAREALQQMRDEIGGDVPVELQVSVGTPWREICRAVETASVDLVVIPTHGRGGLVKVLFGGVAERVVRRSTKPVLTVRPEPPEKA